MWGKGAKACTTNSAHERLMQQEQLSSIVSLQISSVPHFATQCVRSKREAGRGEQRGNKTKSEGKNKQGKTFIALTRRRPRSVSSISNCGGCRLVHGLIINHESFQCAVCRQIKRIVLW